jgi:hypothetical protein
MKIIEVPFQVLRLISLQLVKILTILALGSILFLVTACNPGDMQGARPNNPPVQMGGQNNPYKLGGDENTQYKMSTDPALLQDVAQPKN